MFDHHPPRKPRFQRNLRRKGNALEKDFRLGRVRVTIRDQYKRLKKRWKLSMLLDNVKE